MNLSSTKSSSRFRQHRRSFGNRESPVRWRYAYQFHRKGWPLDQNLFKSLSRPWTCPWTMTIINFISHSCRNLFQILLRYPSTLYPNSSRLFNRLNPTGNIFLSHLISLKLTINFLSFYRELQLDLGDGASISRLNSVEWSIVRSGVNPSIAPPSSNPIRMSTFRSDDDWAEQQAERSSAASLGGAGGAAAVIAASAGSTSTGSPRTQRRSRSGRAADVRVFIWFIRILFFLFFVQSWLLLIM